VPRRRPTLLNQILAVNALLVTATVLVASVAIDFDPNGAQRGRELGVYILALIGTLLANGLLVHRRLDPLERLIQEMETVDLVEAVRPGGEDSGHAIKEVQRLQQTFDRMLERLQVERREAAHAVLNAQEREKRRIAQDLHDEVNQALTAILLRLGAAQQDAPPQLRSELGVTTALAHEAMQELLRLARELRPAALDDLGLVPALRTQVRHFGDRTGIEATFTVTGQEPKLSPEKQLTVYRIVQESLSNVANHADARKVHVELGFVGRIVLRVEDDGHGMRTNGHAPRKGGLGLSGMRERALLAGGSLDIRSREGSGTTVTLTLP
jgi:two-component system sensor histidine kinase UhpB